MKHRPQTFVVTTQFADRATDAALRSSSQSDGITLIFLAGELVSQAARIARSLSVKASAREFLIACVPTVLSEGAEVENEDAIAVLTVPAFSLMLIDKRLSESFLVALRTALSEGTQKGALLLFKNHESSERLQQHLGHHDTVFGGGTLSSEPLLAIRGGFVEKGSVLALLIGGPSFLQVRASSACRLLAPLARITACRGNTLQEIDGAPALNQMSECAAGVDGQFPLHLTIASDAHALSPRGRRLASLPIRGVDPDRSAVLFDESLSSQSRVAFAIPDPLSAQKDLEAHASDLVSNSRGSSPECGIYICSSRRDREFYGRANVDLQILAKRFPALPIIGLHSAFELAPLDGKVIAQSYAGVFALLSRPS